MYYFTHECLTPNWERDRALHRYRHFLSNGEKPWMDYVVEFADGRVAQARDPLYLMDLIIHPNFSDTSFVEMGIMQSAFLHYIVCDEFAMERQTRVWSCDALGPLFDGVLSTFATVEEQRAVDWWNRDDPLELDGWDAWTMVADLMKMDYLSLLEKVPTWRESNKKQECSGCQFFSAERKSCFVWGGAERVFEHICPFPTHAARSESYQRVVPSRIASADFKHMYVPCYARSEESPLFRANRYVQQMQQEVEHS